MDTLRSTIKLLGLPSGGRMSLGAYEWRKEGGFAGASVVDRVMKRAKELGWYSKSSQETSPSGSTVNDRSLLFSPDGSLALSTTVSWGVTKDSNRFRIALEPDEKGSMPHMPPKTESRQHRLREMASMKDGSSEQLIMSALQQGGGAASFVADSIDQAALQKVAASKGVQSKAMGNEVVAWLPGKEPPKTRTEAMDRDKQGRKSRRAARHYSQEEREYRGLPRVADYKKRANKALRQAGKADTETRQDESFSLREALSGYDLAQVAQDIERHVRKLERLIRQTEAHDESVYDELDALYLIADTLKGYDDDLTSPIGARPVEAKVSDIRKVVKEAIEGQVSSAIVVAIDDLQDARRWMGRMNNMTPFSTWGKGDHKKAQQALAKAYRALGVEAKKAGDKELAKAASDAAYYALRGNTDYSTKEAVNAGIARHSQPAAPVSESVRQPVSPAEMDDVMRSIVDDMLDGGDKVTSAAVLARFSEWARSMAADYDSEDAVMAVGRATRRQQWFRGSLVREGLACPVCGDDHPPYWEDDDDAELGTDEEPQCHVNKPMPLGYVYVPRKNAP